MKELGHTWGKSYKILINILYILFNYLFIFVGSSKHSNNIVSPRTFTVSLYIHTDTAYICGIY